MQQSTHASPPEGSPPPTSRIAWWLAMAIIRPAAAGMAGWSLYTVARHYGVPWQLALFASVVFDGIAIACAYQASEAVRAARAATGPVVAALGLASVSVYLNLVHAKLIHGGVPAGLLFATPTIGLLAVSALSWSATRAVAREARGETPMRLPAFGLWGWMLARTEAADALKARAVAHVTSSASPAHQPAAAADRPRSSRAVLAEAIAAMDPVDAIEIASRSHPKLDHAGLAELLAAYGITVDALQVALVLGRAATPSVRLDRIPAPDPSPLPGREGQQPALGAMMRGDTPTDMPLVSGLTKADAITVMAKHFGGLNTEPAAVVQALAWQGMATDTAYVRTTLSRARKAEAAEEAKQQAEQERRYGNGGYA